MADAEMWLIVSILIALLAIAIGFFIVTRRQKKKFRPNYDTLLAIGPIFMIIGLATDPDSGMWIIGTAMFVIGLYGKSKKG
jgi:uncharacterized membrane protein SirB2